MAKQADKQASPALCAPLVRCGDVADSMLTVLRFYRSCYASVKVSFVFCRNLETQFIHTPAIIKMHL